MKSKKFDGSSGFGLWAVLVAALMMQVMPVVAQASCTTAREYITTLEFLRDRKDLAVPEADAQKVSRQVAKGCTGAAQRFIRISVLMSKAGMGSKDSLQKSIEFSARTDREAETFATVFKQAFFEEGLDLDLRASMKMAESLTSEFEGDSLGVRDDFEKLVSYCSDKEKLELPRPQCGAFAARLAKLGHRWGGGISAPFVSAFEYLRSEKGPALPTGKALQLAEKLMTAGPDAPNNFITAYKYAVNKKGLGLSESPALAFATDLGLDTPEKKPSK